ncbi:phosphatase PAP2 family protein [Microbacterium galbinum]|uniref:phosphatase PAP2 family protein n=1 Tax=Microbacterium galbinum TaxID=2851646 RepID=UPI001FFCD927|nr:phosphatase PAP2 family protein [Microbacterium galbinum]
MDRRMLVWSGVGCVALTFALGALITLGVAHPFVFDAWWNDVVVSFRSEGLVAFAHALDTVGGGWVAVYLVPLVVIISFLLARRWRSGVFAALAFLASAGAVQLLKHLFGRARPEDMLVLSDYGSFPSGHTANAATLAFVFAVLFPNVWIRIAGALWIVLMALSRTFLSVHWATDTIGGALLGAGVVLLLAAWLLPWVRRPGAAEPPADSLDDAPLTDAPTH